MQLSLRPYITTGVAIVGASHRRRPYRPDAAGREDPDAGREHRPRTELRRS